MEKVTKRELLDLANTGNWTYHNGENRCDECGEYQFTGEHKDYCRLGELLRIIEESGIK